MQRAELEQLSSEELHDRAVKHAIRHADIGFLWSLVKAVPVAQAATGQVDDAETDIMSVAALLTDLMETGEGEVAHALRPLYLEYLEKNG